MIIISDIHGCYYTLRRLLKKCPDEEIIFLGDMIDRGPNSKQVVEFAMKERISAVIGNHEHMMVDHYLKYREYERNLWLDFNGGGDAVKSWGGEIPDEIVYWVNNLPIAIKRDNLLLSHTGHGTHESLLEAVWCRDLTFPNDGLFRVLGHTQFAYSLLGPNFIRIDTGAAYPKFGTLTALQYPEMRIFNQKYDETPL
jgi:serine/threonine protein phosphatase 1